MSYQGYLPLERLLPRARSPGHVVLVRLLQTDSRDLRTSVEVAVEVDETEFADGFERG